MKWVKIPAEHHPLFLAALPVDKRINAVKMFGGLGAIVNGNMFAGLWAKSVMVKLSPEDQARAIELGSVPFDPLGNGRVMADSYVLPDDVIGDDKGLRDWLARALDYTATLPPKKKAGAKKSGAKKSSAKKSGAKKPGAKKSSAKKSGAKKPGAKKPGTKKPVAKKPGARKARARRT